MNVVVNGLSRKKFLVAHPMAAKEAIPSGWRGQLILKKEGGGNECKDIQTMNLEATNTEKAISGLRAKTKLNSRIMLQEQQNLKLSNNIFTSYHHHKQSGLG